MASVAAAATSPVPAATPLEQRQWRRQAQRSYRLALTAVKEARSRYDAAHSAGLQRATALSNALLTQQYLPGMPLGALKGMRGLLEASARKLVLRQQQALQQLHAALRDIEATAADMAAALEDVRSCGGAASTGGGSDDGNGGDGPDDSRATSKGPEGFQQRMPIFNSINLSTAVDMLSELLGMYQKDCRLKQQLVAAMEGAVVQAAQAAAAGKGAGGGGGSGGAGGHDEGKAQLTVCLSSWLARPYLEEARVDHLLLVLTDDMAGF
jgi:hypothetical protein